MRRGDDQSRGPAREWGIPATCAERRWGAGLLERVDGPSQVRPSPRVRPEPGVIVSVLAGGELELFSELTRVRFRCGPPAAAMWIALRQHDGHREAAARALAGVWGADPADLRVDLELWTDELCDAGLLRSEF